MPDDAASFRPAGSSGGRTRFEVAPPRPARSMLLTGWPVMLLIVLLAFVVGVLFPVLAAPVIIAAPLAVAGAFTVAAIRARGIRLVVTPEVVRVTSGKDGVSCDRSHVERIVLVENLKRRPLAPRSPDLMLLDKGGRTVLLLSGLLWPLAILEQVIAALAPLPAERVPGPQTALSLIARYPSIFVSPDGAHRGLASRRRGLVIGLCALGAVSVLLLVGTFVR